MINLLEIEDFETQPYFIAMGGNYDDAYLTNHIAKRQKEILIFILGHEEYYNFDNDFGGGILPQSQKWIDFLNGTTYTKNNKHIVFDGIKKVIKLYVYYWFQRNNILQNSDFGGVKVDLKNAKLSFEGQKTTDAYNEMIDLIGKYSNDTPTVYNYLNDHDFKAEMTFLEKINNIY